MHPCLKQPEILYLIFQEVYHRPAGSHVEKDLLALALTCQGFKDAALDVLWNTQVNFGPLIKILRGSPAGGISEDFDYNDLLEVAEKAYVPSPAALRRFSSYAQRIRRFSHVPDARSCGLQDISRDLAAMVALFEKITTELPEPLFPNLQHLEFVETMSWTSLTGIIIFSGSKIRSLSLFWGELDSTQSEVFFGILGRLGLYLEVLELVPLSFIPAPSDPNRQSIFPSMSEPMTLSQILPKLNELRSLSCGSDSLTPRAIRNLASRRKFYKLQTSNSSEDILSAITDSIDGIVSPFIGLQHLELYEKDFRDFIKLVEHMRPMSLQNLILHHSVIPSASTLSDLIQVLAISEGQHLPSLRQFTLKYTPADTDATLSLTMDTVVNGLTLGPLLLFPNLNIVEIDTPCAFDLRDTDIQAMAKAWPQLRRLQLGSKIGWGLPTSVTLTGILDLLTACVHLEHFAVPFDAKSDPPPVVSSTPVNKNITYLYVGNGRAPKNQSQQEALARLVKHVFPNVCGVGGEWMFRQSITGWESQKEWDAVIARTKVHRSEIDTSEFHPLQF